MGNPEPHWTGGLNVSLKVGKLELGMLIEHQAGGDLNNMTRASMYQYGTHKDTEIRGELRSFGKDMLCYNTTCEVLNGAVVGPGAGTAVVIGEGWFSGGPLGNGQGGPAGPLTARLEDGTHTRLREVSVGYTWRFGRTGTGVAPQEITVRLAGQNLKLWTEYSGLDPATNMGGAANPNRGIDWFGTPLNRSVALSVALRR
jgi:hypothetical protein